MSEILPKTAEPMKRPALGMHPAPTNKVGLALSGGGFRAAFYHLGVLASLADRGILRHVEVISAVSGGSIVATLYYLHLKRLLESVPDSTITDDDYRTIVGQMERQFLAAVERNFRLSTFVSIRANWKMRQPDYSRTDRIGELYDTWLFRPALAGPDGKLPPNPIEMRDLKIYPAGDSTSFHPRRHNASRSAKVPILLINSTNLNTGRNWRFEASRMGEAPPHGIDLFDIDKVTRLERPNSYDELPDHLARMPLGKAVAASTAVPGILHPLPLSGLYPKRRLQLVDGGIHDNQGLQGLLDERCSTFIVSDASGQMEEEKKPVPSWGPVLARANGILMNRIREEQLIPLSRQPMGLTKNRDQARPAKSPQRAALIHMKKGLSPEHVSYRKAHVQGPKRSPSQASETKPQPSMSSSRRPRQRTGITGPRPVLDERVQKSLARVRTDLDSFTEIEAFSLMADGYYVSERVIPRFPAIANLRGPGGMRRSAWNFLAVEPWLHHPTPEYLKHLRTAAGSLLKVFRLAPWLSWVTLACFVGLFGLVLHFFGAWEWLVESHQVELTWSWGKVLLALIVGLAFILGWGRLRALWSPVVFVQRPPGWMGRLLFQAILPIIGAVFIKIYLLTFDRLFLAAGRLERLGPVVDVRERRPTSLTGTGASRHPS